MNRSVSDEFTVVHRGEEIKIRVLRARKKNVSFKAEADLSITVRATHHASAKQIRDIFKQEKYLAAASEMIRKKREENSVAPICKIGGYFYFLGEKVPIAAGESEISTINGVLPDKELFYVPRYADSAEITALIFDHYRRTAEKFLTDLVKKYAGIKGVTIAGVKINFNRSAWGSCTKNGDLAFSAFLMAYPQNAVEYIVLHEICHRIKMDHSPDFYKEISSVMPDYKKRRDLLKQSLAPRE